MASKRDFPDDRYPLFATVRWGFDGCVLRAVKRALRSQRNAGFRPDSGLSRGGPLGALSARSGSSHKGD
jgi:hypothetical protein